MSAREIYADVPILGEDNEPTGETIRVFLEDVETIERAAESLMRHGDAANAVQMFALALRWRMAITEHEGQRDRRESIEGKAKRGAWAESIAVTFLIEQGYEVFRNTSHTGPIDLVAVTRSGDAILIDVKTTIPGPSGHNRYRAKPKPEQEALGVLYLYVNPNGTCSWGDSDAVT